MITKMWKKSILKNVLMLTSLVGFIFFLNQTISLYNELKDRKINFMVSKNKVGHIELTASVLMEGNTWRYFRGIPFIEIYGVDFSCFFKNGGLLFVENKTEYGVECVCVEEEFVKLLKCDMCNETVKSDCKNGYRIIPSSVKYQVLKGQKFVNTKKSKSLNYRRGVNNITIVLKNFSETNGVSGKLIFVALNNRILLIYPILGAVFFGALLLFLLGFCLLNLINKNFKLYKK